MNRPAASRTESAGPRSAAVSCECATGANRRRFLLPALVLCLAAAWLPLPVGAIGIEDQLQLADGLFDRGMYEMAIREYVFVIDNTTNHPRADEITYRVGESYRQLTNNVKAMEYFFKVEMGYPSSPWCLRSMLRRGEMLESAGRMAELAVLMNRVLAAEPPDDTAASALYMLASALKKTGERDKAGEAYERVIRDYPASPVYPYALLSFGAMKASEPGGVERAARLYQSAATNKTLPRVAAEAWFQLGSLYFREKSYPESAEAFHKLFQLYPSDSRVSEAMLPRAWALFYAEKPADALRVVDDALSSAYPAEKVVEEWLYLKANCERQLMRPAEAVKTYAELLKRFPSGKFAGPAAFERVVSLYKAENYREAIREGGLITPEPSVRKDLYWLLAESHIALKDEDGAIQYYRLLMDRCPDADLAPDAGYRLGHLLQKRREYVAAADVFGRVAARYATNDIAAQALFASAMCRSKAGKPDDALRDWGILLEKFPDSPLADEALYQKGMIEVLLHRDEQAAMTLRELLKKNGATKFAAEARYWLGVLLDGGGKAKDAESELRLALDAGPDAEMGRRIRLQLALVLQKTGKTDESAALLAPLVESTEAAKIPSSVLMWLSEYQLSRGGHADAVLSAMALAAEGRGDAWRQTGLCLAGRALQQSGKTGEAKEMLEKALAIPGNHESRPEAAWRLGEIEFGARDYEKAREHFEEAARLASDDKRLHVRVRSYAGIARILKAQGKKEEAAKYFMSVAILFDDPELVPECLYEAGRIFRDLGRTAEGDKALKELADRYPDSSWAARKEPAPPEPGPVPQDDRAPAGRDDGRPAGDRD